MDEDGFYVGQLESGQRGLVPSNFLRENNEVNDRVWKDENDEMLEDNNDQFNHDLVSPGGVNGSYDPRRRPKIAAGRVRGGGGGNGIERPSRMHDATHCFGGNVGVDESLPRIRRVSNISGDYQEPVGFLFLVENLLQISMLNFWKSVLFNSHLQ